MVAGPHTENIMAGNSCSHTLTTPLKVYLPLLSLKEGEYTVIDERAGVDGVGTGITTGFDLAVIVSEPTLHGLKTAKQIADMLEFYKTPYVFALNKVHDEKEGGEAFENVFGFSPNFIFPFTKTLGNFGAGLEEKEKEEFKKIKEKLHLISNDRRAKTKEKFEKAKNIKDYS
jgi:CO dehydrogenase nickel-insertion accessory protein CooC1